MTAAAAIGTTRYDIDLFLKRLEKNFKELLKPAVSKISNGLHENDRKEDDHQTGTDIEQNTIDNMIRNGPRNLPWKSQTPTIMKTSKSLSALNDEHCNVTVDNSSVSQRSLCFSEGDEDGSRTWPKVNKVVREVEDVKARRALWFDKPPSIENTLSGVATALDIESAQTSDRKQTVIVKKALSADKLSFMIDL